MRSILRWLAQPAVLTLAIGSMLAGCSDDSVTSSGDDSFTSSGDDSGRDAGIGSVDAPSDAREDARPGGGDAGKNCIAAPSACGFPDGTNTGVPPGAKLKPVKGGLEITKPGAIIEDQEIDGCVTVNAPNVTIRRSRIRGACAFAVRNMSTGLTLSDVEISCADTGGTGVSSSNFTVVRANIHGCENGFDVSGNVSVKDSWIHDLYAGGEAHTDGAQFNQGAAHITFDHNTIQSPNPGGTSAVIMWDEDDPQNQDVTISNNLLDGGAYTLYCPRKPAQDIRILNNRFASAHFGPTSSCTQGHVTEFTGNVFDEDGKPVPQG